jgi:hypothetical protein
MIFDKWTTDDGVVFADENSASTTFTMPDSKVEVTATYQVDKTALEEEIRTADKVAPGVKTALPPYYKENYKEDTWAELIDAYADAAEVYNDPDATPQQVASAAEALAEALAATLEAIGSHDHPVVGDGSGALAAPDYNYETTLTEFGRQVQIEFKGHVGTVTSLRLNGVSYRVVGQSGFAHPDAGFKAYDILEASGARVGTITEGSAIVTLGSEFADRFANGTHRLEVSFADPVGTGSGKASIKVQRTGSNGENPIWPTDGTDGSANTGDAATPMLWLTLLSLAFTGMLLVTAVFVRGLPQSVARGCKRKEPAR